VQADGINLYLKGIDELICWQRHQHKNRRYLKRENRTTQFAKIKLHLTSFADKRVPSGKNAYPFSIRLPQNLPPTECCKHMKIRGLMLKTYYVLVAEL
jgi:hypothetical protein